MKENFKFLLSVAVIVSLILGCSKLSDLAGDSSDKLFFCVSYNSSTDKCEGKSGKYTTGFLTVMIDLRPTKRKVGVDKVNINVTNIKTGDVVDTYPYDTDPTMDYVYFDKVDFKSPGKYKVSALKPDGTVLVSNEIEIIE
ncbi:MAG: hypothetical protein SGI89_01165 [bacterium]|nr:hypothetical protein [bacterium]